MAFGLALARAQCVGECGKRIFGRKGTCAYLGPCGNLRDVKLWVGKTVKITFKKYFRRPDRRDILVVNDTTFNVNKYVRNF